MFAKEAFYLTLIFLRRELVCIHRNATHSFPDCIMFRVQILGRESNLGPASVIIIIQSLISRNVFVHISPSMCV